MHDIIFLFIDIYSVCISLTRSLTSKALSESI